jgi:hypothetical protein
MMSQTLHHYIILFLFLELIFWYPPRVFLNTYVNILYLTKIV